MYSNARKFGLSLTLAHQYLAQLDTKISDAILGNTGTMISLHAGHQDAIRLAPILGEQIDPSTLTDLDQYYFISRTGAGIDRKLFTGRVDEPDSLTRTPDRVAVEKLIRIAREKFGKDREFVEGRIEGSMSKW